MAAIGAKPDTVRAVVAMLTACAEGDIPTASQMIAGNDADEVVGIMASLLLQSWFDLGRYDGECVQRRLQRIGAFLATIP